MNVQKIENTSRDVLKSISLFSRLSSQQRNLIQSSCKEVKVSKGAVIIQQEESSFDLYVILSGAVRVSLINKDGREVMLDVLREGAVFGELSVLDQRCRSAMVTAVTEVSMLFLPREAFIRILHENSEIAVGLLSVLAMRIRKANETIETLTFLDVAGRVAKVLLDLASAGGEATSDGYISVHCPTHQTIASQIGASREAVTKAIKSLASHGLIAMNGKNITISPRHFELL